LLAELFTPALQLLLQVSNLSFHDLGPSSGSSKPLVVNGRTAPASLHVTDRCRDYLVLGR
jgi:hypothetical protein